MAVFGLLVEENDLVRGYFVKMADRLQKSSWLQPLKGNVGSRKLCRNGPGRGVERLYVVAVEPIYPRFVFNVMILFLVVAAVSLQLILSWTAASYVVYAFAALAALLVNMFWSSSFYELVIRLQLRRLVGRKVQVSPGTLVALRGLANGKV